MRNNKIHNQVKNGFWYEEIAEQGIDPFKWSYAAGDCTKFLNALLNEQNGTAPIDWDTDTIKLALFGVTATVTTIDTSQSFYGSFTAHEVTGTGYTAGGVAIAARSVSVSGSYVVLMGNPITFTATAAGFTGARWGLIYKDTGTPATSALKARLDLGTTRSNQGGDFVVKWAGTGTNKVLKAKWSA